MSSIKNTALLALFAFFFSLGILSISHWQYAGLFSLSIFAAYQWLYERKNHWIYLLLGGIIALAYAYLLSPFSWAFVVFLFLGILVFTYEKGIHWRKIPFLKPVLISLCWFALGIGIPKFALFGQIPNQDFSHILLFFVLAIVEDLEDRAVDEGYIKTIPLYLKKSEMEALISLWLFCYLALSNRIDLFSERMEIKLLSIMLTIAPFIYFIYLKKSPKINHRYFDFILFLIGLLHLLV
ncbi:MAG: hypothetical protein RIS20_1435 [Bacteroidota bacterium]|jgi:hypothetical protein